MIVSDNRDATIWSITLELSLRVHRGYL